MYGSPEAVDLQHQESGSSSLSSLYPGKSHPWPGFLVTFFGGDGNLGGPGAVLGPESPRRSAIRASASESMVSVSSGTSSGTCDGNVGKDSSGVAGRFADCPRSWSAGEVPFPRSALPTSRLFVEVKPLLELPLPTRSSRDSSNARWSISSSVSRSSWPSSASLSRSLSSDRRRPICRLVRRRMSPASLSSPRRSDDLSCFFLCS